MLNTPHVKHFVIDLITKGVRLLSMTALPDVGPETSNGAGLISSPAPEALPPCPLNSLPQDVHNYIHALEERLRAVETALYQNSERTRSLGALLFKNPAAKMFMAALPKEAQQRLQETFGGENGNK